VNELLDTLATWKIPFVEPVVPLMRTGWPTNKPTVALVLTVATPELQVMLVIEFTV
jgi:hypothetical protein